MTSHEFHGVSNLWHLDCFLLVNRVNRDGINSFSCGFVLCKQKVNKQVNNIVYITVHELSESHMEHCVNSIQSFKQMRPSYIYIYVYIEI